MKLKLAVLDMHLEHLNCNQKQIKAQEILSKLTRYVPFDQTESGTRQLYFTELEL